MSEEKVFTLITALATVALALAIAMATAGIDQLKQKAENFDTNYKENPFAD